MKIGFHGCELPEGSHKYNDPRVAQLVEKFSPKKISPYYMSFFQDEISAVDGVLVVRDNVLDVLIPDIEFCEARIERSADDAEKQLMKKCLDLLEGEVPLSHATFSAEEEQQLQGMTLHSRKPVAIVEEPPDIDTAMNAMLAAARVIFFYTAGPKEVHAWPVKEGTDIVTCAGVIHSDLARGFIRADVVSCDNLLQSHNFNDAKTKGFVEGVGKSYIIQAGDVIEVHFSV